MSFVPRVYPFPVGAGPSAKVQRLSRNMLEGLGCFPRGKVSEREAWVEAKAAVRGEETSPLHVMVRCALGRAAIFFLERGREDGRAYTRRFKRASTAAPRVPSSRVKELRCAIVFPPDAFSFTSRAWRSIEAMPNSRRASSSPC